MENSNKKEYVISVFSENSIGILQRICAIFTRRHTNIDSLNVSESEISNVHRLTIVVHMTEADVKKIVGQVTKQVEVLSVFFNSLDQVISKEMAFYKLDTKIILDKLFLEDILQRFGASIVHLDKKHLVLRKIGSRAQTKELYDFLYKEIGILEFCRTGQLTVSNSDYEKHMGKYNKSINQ